MPRDPRYLGNATGYADRQKSPLASSSMNRATLQEEALRAPEDYEPRRKDNLFLWTVFLLLLVGFTMACWIGSYVLFSRPELPVSYRILRKIKKIDLPQRFKVSAAPQGEFMGPEKLFNRYNGMTAPELRTLNRDLERSYLRNYATANPQVPYVTGRFTILDTFELQPTDFIPSGVVALAVSSDFPKLIIEHIYSTSPTQAPLIKRNLQTGMPIELRRTYELTAVLHVTKLDDGHVQLTVVPINYGAYEFKGAIGGFRLDPPTELRVAAGWPLVRAERREEANNAYLNFLTRSGQGPLVVKKDGAKLPDTALKGVDVAVPAETPPVALAGNGSPAPLNGKGNVVDGKKSGLPMASPAPALAQNNVPVRMALPVAEAPRRPLPAQPTVLSAVAPSQGSGGIPLQPFLTAPAAPSASGAGDAPAVGAAATPAKTWRTYPRGQTPPGRNVRVSDIPDLVQRVIMAGEPIYLGGHFVVRAIGENKAKGIKNAVLRSEAQSNVRVIVEYPPDLPLPPEGSEVNRDEERPYQITVVRQTADGINVFAREISE